MADRQFYTVEELAELLKVSHQTIHNWIREGRLKDTFKIGRVVRVPVASFEQFLKENSGEGAAGDEEGNIIAPDELARSLVSIL